MFRPMKLLPLLAASLLTHAPSLHAQAPFPGQLPGTQIGGSLPNGTEPSK